MMTGLLVRVLRKMFLSFEILDANMSSFAPCRIRLKNVCRDERTGSGALFWNLTLASGAWPDRGRPGPKPGLKAEVSPATSQALAGLAKG